MNVDELQARLEELRRHLSSEMRDRWDRSLPFAELLSDRWRRAAELGFGEGTSIYESAIVLGDVSIGGSCWIGPNVLLDGSGAPLRIGDGCDISAGVQLYTHDTARRCVSGGALPATGAPITIGGSTYIGSQTVVAPGVAIGTRCVIGANSFVNRDVPDRVIAAGSPALRIGVVVGEGRETRFEYDRDHG